MCLEVQRFQRALSAKFDGKTHGPTKLRRCVLPGNHGHMVCHHTVAKLLGFGRKKWKTVEKALKEGVSSTHGLDGRQGNKYNALKNSLLKDFCDEYVVPFSNPRATSIVRSIVGDHVRTELRDDDDEVVELHSGWSKRGLYALLLNKYCGWREYFDSKGGVLRKVAIEGQKQINEHPSWWMI